MASEGRKRAIAEVFDRIFKDREVILRSDGRVGYLRIQRWMQIAACALLLVAVGWVLFATFGVYHRGNLVAERDREIAQQQVAYFDLLAEISEYHEQYATITADLESNQDYLLSLLTQDGSGGQSIEAIQGRLRDSVTERDRVVLARESLQNRLRAFETDLQTIANKNVSLQTQVAEMTSTLETTEAERAQVAAARERLGIKLREVEGELQRARSDKAALEEAVAALRAGLAEAEARQESLEAAERDLAGRIAKREQALSESQEARARLEADLSDLQGELAQVSERQGSLATVEERLQTRITELEAEAKSGQDARRELESELAALRDQAADADSVQAAQRSRLESERESLSQRLAEIEARDQALRTEIADLTATLRTAERTIESARRARDMAVGELRELETELHAVSRAKAESVASVQNLRGALDAALAEGETLKIKRESFESQVAELETRLSEAEGRGEALAQQLAALQDSKAAAESERDQLAGQKTELERKIAKLGHDLDHAVTVSEARETEVARLTAEVEQANRVGAGHESEKLRLVERVASLERELSQMRNAQESIVKRLSARTLSSVDTMEKTISMTGVDLKNLLAQIQIEQPNLGRGGPFIPGEFLGDGPRTDELQSSVALLDLHIGRWEALQEIVRTLPLVAPLEQYRLSSGFGYRKDPLNGRKALHEGLDFSAPTRTPIFATSSGKVVFAGWRGRYGRLVEIDHGLGVKTRYAHMKKILVKPGQEIGHRDKIGLVGSSGRSTGPHLHYEVLVNGKPVDPMNFLKAGNHVFKS